MQSSFSRRGPRGRFLFFIPVILAVGAALSAAVMLLWNNLMPELFALKKISFWQALGLLALCRILFGNFGGKGRPGGGRMNRGQQLREKWGTMNDEERQAFRDEWRKRCKR
jgi:hypothetical protein